VPLANFLYFHVSTSPVLCRLQEVSIPSWLAFFLCPDQSFPSLSSGVIPAVYSTLTPTPQPQATTPGITAPSPQTPKFPKPKHSQKPKQPPRRKVSTKTVNVGRLTPAPSASTPTSLRRRVLKTCLIRAFSWCLLECVIKGYCANLGRNFIVDPDKVGTHMPCAVLFWPSNFHRNKSLSVTCCRISKQRGHTKDEGRLCG